MVESAHTKKRIMRHQHNDLMIVEIATGREVTSIKEMEWLLEHKDEAKSQFAVYCRECHGKLKEHYKE